MAVSNHSVCVCLGEAATCADSCYVWSLPSADLDLEAAHTSNEGCKACKGLLAAAAHSHQHGIALWL